MLRDLIVAYGPELVRRFGRTPDLAAAQAVNLVLDQVRAQLNRLGLDFEPGIIALPLVLHGHCETIYTRGCYFWVRWTYADGVVQTAVLENWVARDASRGARKIHARFAA